MDGLHLMSHLIRDTLRRTSYRGPFPIGSSTETFCGKSDVVGVPLEVSVKLELIVRTYNICLWI